MGTGAGQPQFVDQEGIRNRLCMTCILSVLQAQHTCTKCCCVCTFDLLILSCSEVAKFCQKYLAAEITRLEKYHQGNLPDSLVEVSEAGIQMHAPMCLPMMACCKCHWRSSWGQEQQVIACEMYLHVHSKGMKLGLKTSASL